jgi:iron complex outermembrane receptor protein
VAEQLFGLQQVEVLKGPGSLLYGLVLPGGLVNMVSKRPQGNDFANVDVTVGSHDFYQSTVDLNKSLSENGKQAFRINGLISNSNDATDNVWFKNRYIAPSLSLDLGARTDFTILTSYQERNYVRQQGCRCRARSTATSTARCRAASSSASRAHVRMRPMKPASAMR